MLHWIFKAKTALTFIWPLTSSITLHNNNLRIPQICPESISHHLAQYSPWFPAGLYPEIPQGCHVEQVNILHRHGARWPTSGAGNLLQTVLKNLQEAVKRKGPVSQLYWLIDYKYTLKSDDLVPLGKLEALQSGTSAAYRYTHLAREKGIFIRASSRYRVVQTSNYWIQAFERQSKLNLPKPLIISDAYNSNDSLANNDCPRHKPIYAHAQWAQVMSTSIIKRLQSEVMDYTLSARDIIVLLTMCAFESAALGKCSRFCGIFTGDEILDYEYFNDLEKFYNTGYGNLLGPVQGVGYVNELLARLQDRQVEDGTQTNTTLDRDEQTFPLKLGVYADFSHDNTMAAIVSAMGLFNEESEGMPLHYRPEGRIWRFGHIAPFAGRMVVERLQCVKPPPQLQQTDLLSKDQTAWFVRIIVNDALQEVDFCGTGDPWETEHSLCHLDEFVASQSFARKEGQERWKECF